MQGFSGCENLGMSEYEALRGDIEQVAAAVARYAGAVTTHVDAMRIVTDELWKDNAALRDELHALANRHESLTKLVARHITLTAPDGIAEVAELRREVFPDA